MWNGSNAIVITFVVELPRFGQSDDEGAQYEENAKWSQQVQPLSSRHFAFCTLTLETTNQIVQLQTYYSVA